MILNNKRKENANAKYTPYDEIYNKPNRYYFNNVFITKDCVSISHPQAFFLSNVYDKIPNNVKEEHLFYVLTTEFKKYFTVYHTPSLIKHKGYSFFANVLREWFDLDVKLEKNFVESANVVQSKSYEDFFDSVVKTGYEKYVSKKEKNI